MNHRERELTKRLFSNLRPVSYVCETPEQRAQVDANVKAKRKAQLSNDDRRKIAAELEGTLGDETPYDLSQPHPGDHPIYCTCPQCSDTSITVTTERAINKEE